MTACPKCYVHLSCAQKDYGTHKDRKKIPLIDLNVLAASRIVKRAKDRDYFFSSSILVIGVECLFFM